MAECAMRRTLPNRTWRQIRLAHAGGVGIRELARKMGIPAGTALARVARERWSQDVEETAASLQSRAIITPSEKKARKLAEMALETRLVLAEIHSRAAASIADMTGAELIARAQEIAQLAKAAADLFGWRSSHLDTKSA